MEKNVQRFLSKTFFASLFLVSFIQAEVDIRQIENATDPRINDAQQVFVRSFEKAYTEPSIYAGLNVPAPYPEFKAKGAGKEIFNEFKIFLQTPEEGEKFFLFVASDDNKIIGFASFKQRLNEPYEVYVDQMAVDPDHWGSLTGKNLLFSICNELPDLKKMLLITRRQNARTIAFYKKHGFTESPFIEKGYDQEIYVGYEKDLVKQDGIERN